MFRGYLEHTFFKAEDTFQEVSINQRVKNLENQANELNFQPLLKQKKAYSVTLYNGPIKGILLLSLFYRR